VICYLATSRDVMFCRPIDAVLSLVACCMNSSAHSHSLITNARPRIINALFQPFISHAKNEYADAVAYYHTASIHWHTTLHRQYWSTDSRIVWQISISLFMVALWK